jgi:hypothetical protein
MCETGILLLALSRYNNSIAEQDHYFTDPNQTFHLNLAPDPNSIILYEV